MYKDLKVKKTLTSFLVGLLLLLPLQISNAATPKAGAACAKLNQTQISGNLKFKCIKSGKKLVWDKGVPLSASKVLPSTKPTSAKTSNPSPSASTSPSVLPPIVPTSFEDLIQHYDGISYGAWVKSRDEIIASNKTEIVLKLSIGPNTQLTYKDPQYPIDLITKLYSGYPTKAEVNFLAFNFQDREWATEKMETILPNAGSGWIKDVACKSIDICWGGGSFSNGADKYLIVEAMGFIDANHTSGSLEAHEFTHIIQQMTFKQGRPAAAYLYDPWPPTWYWEGQAHFAQHASVYFDSYESYIRQRRATAQTLYSDNSFNTEHIKNYFVFNAPTDWQHKYDAWHQYDLGAMFVEILTAVKGPASTMEIWSLTGNGMKFPEAFQQIYGISFNKALPIISKAIALELGHS
jgi:hypothetical protein